MQAVPAASRLLLDVGQKKKRYTPENYHVPKKETISIGNTSSNHHFSGDMLVFRGVTFKVWVFKQQRCFLVFFERPNGQVSKYI